jgi:serine/threonine protein kinase
MIAPNTHLGRFEIRCRLGAGGMGEVYLAQDMRLGRRAALKILPFEMIKDAERVRRFEQEAQAASALNHPNILTIYEIGAEGDVHFIAAEFIDGETLRGRLRETNLSLHEALDIAIQTASALSAAHEAGIIHRDIKPDNIMLRRDGFVKLVDFGLAKLSEAMLKDSAVETEAATKALVKTEAGVVMGTVHYMSPEQARQRHGCAHGYLEFGRRSLRDARGGTQTVHGRNADRCSRFNFDG